MSIKPKSNNLVTQLLYVSQINNKEVSSRLKLSSIICEFDKQISNNFITFVNLSNARYHNIKRGKNIEETLTNQKGVTSSLSNKILFNPLYHSEDLEAEKNKLPKNLALTPKAKIIKEIQNQIIASLSDSKKQEKQLEKKPVVNTVKVKRSRSRTKNFLTALHLFPSERTGYKSNIHHNTDTIRRQKYQKDINKHTKVLLEVVRDDEQLINKKFNNYKQDLSNVKQELINNGTNSTQESKKFKKQRQLSLTSSLKLLNYKEEPKPVIKPINPLNQLIDINKVMKYTKRHQKAKSKSDHLLIPSIMTDTNRGQVNAVPLTQTSYPITERCSTINVLKLEAEKCLAIDEKFNEKKQRLDKLLNYTHRPLPRINSNDQMSISKKFNKDSSMKLLSIPTSPMSSKSIKLIKDLKRDLQLNSTTKEKEKEKQKEINDIYDRFINVYKDKKEEWEKEDERMKLGNEAHKAKMKKVYSFLNTLNNTNRKSNLFIDPYSALNRDNERINEFSKTIGNSLLNKKELNENINTFIEAKSKKVQEIKEKIQREDNELSERMNKEKKRKLKMLDDYNAQLAKEPCVDIQLGDSKQMKKRVCVFNNLKLKQGSFEKENKIKEAYEDLMSFRQVIQEKANQKALSESKEQEDECDLNNGSISKKASSCNSCLPQDIALDNQR